MFLIALLLKIIIFGTDIVLGDVYREAGLLVGFMKSALEYRRTEALIFLIRSIPSFTCHKFVVAVIAAKSLNQFRGGKAGVIVVVRFDGLIDHFNHFEVWIMFFNRINPISPSLFCFVNIEFDQPLRVLRPLKFDGYNM